MRAFFLLLLLPFVKAGYPVKCTMLDFFYSTSNCCNENNDATCLQSIPHLEYSADVSRLETTLTEIGLCSNTTETCIKDLPSLSYLRDRIKNITDGGIEIAIQVANSKQDRHPNLDAIVNGTLPTLTLKNGSTFLVEEGATLKVDGNLDAPQLHVGKTADTALEVGHLKVDEIHGPIDFNSHELSNVNVKDLKIDGVAVTASAAELNVLANVDTELTFNDINKVKGLEASAAELNTLHDSGVVAADLKRLIIAKEGESEANKVVTADASGNVVFKKNVEIDGDLNIPFGKLKINGVVVDKTAAELNDAVAHFVGLTATTEEINTLEGIEATTAELNKLHLVSADTDDFNRLDITTEGVSEAGKVVTADENNTITFSGDVAVEGTLELKSLKIGGAAVTSSAADLNVLKDVSASAAQLNALNVSQLGQSEAGKALIPDSNGDLSLNGDLTMASSVKTTTTAASHDYVANGLCMKRLTHEAEMTLQECRDLTLQIHADGGACGLLDQNSNRHLVLGKRTEAECTGAGELWQQYDLEFVVYSGNPKSCYVCEPGLTVGLNSDYYVSTEYPRYVATPGSTTTENKKSSLTVAVGALHLGGKAVTVTAAEINILDGVDPGLTAAHLNPTKDFTGDWAALDVLSGVTASKDELNMLDIEELGKSEASKVVTADAANKVTLNDLKILGAVDVETLTLGGVNVTVTAAQLNQFTGFTADAASLNKLTELDVDSSDLNKLKDVTADAADLNRADIAAEGQSEASKVVTSDSSGNTQFNGDVVVTGSVNVAAGELKVAGTAITATAAEINKLDAMTSTAAELNTLHGVTLGQSAASKAVTADASGNVKFNGDVEITGDLDIPSGKLKLGGVVLDASHDGADISSATNHFLDLTVTADELNVLDDIQATTAELNLLHGVTATTTELNYVAGVTLGQAAANKVVTTDAANKATIPNVDATVLDVATLKLNGAAVTATAADINRLSGLTADAAELNKLDGYTGTAADLSKLSDLTATAAELNTLVGVHADLKSTHLNIMKDVTASAVELNKVSGLTASVAQLDKVKDLTATAAELNALHDVLPGVVSANKAVIVDANSELTSDSTVTVTGTLNAGTLKIDGTAVTASTADLNSVADLATSKTKLLDLAEVTSTASQIDEAVSKAALVSTADLTKLSEITATSTELNTCANFLVSQSADTPTCTQFGQMIYLTKTNGDTELHFCKSATASIGPLA